MSYESTQNLMIYLRLGYTCTRLSEMIEDAIKSKSSYLDFFEKVLHTEYQAREESRIATSLKISGLPRGMHLENFDFLFQPSIDKARIDMLATCDFIDKRENVLIFGPPGVGKTHIGVALGMKAVHLGYSVIYYSLEELMMQLKRRSDIPVFKQRGRAYVKNSLVLLDELGYKSLDRNETHLFFQFVSARYMKGSTIITSNRSVKEWVSIFADDHMATTAILDRLFYKAHIFNIDGNSYRLKNYSKLMKESDKNDLI